ncbi:DUF3987 domain-containing protein [Niallia endozanthoxylica]|uniref:DUF3987 domain-containing protein n=1 Tax=Niallia endozanthoxylica TaxID=2036016 RepID=A0A5J5GVX1_9BACI|nr:DUF3987 domain-containing protein [Niallia endozanthoxylica]KAA9012400.1 DUF3987 domain-containing protein [Niallia endozanthoxylica]
MSEHQQVINIQNAAKFYTKFGLRVLPVQYRSKQPSIGQGWQKLNINEDEIGRYFSSLQNIGVLLGEVSQGLIDVDLDTIEATMIAHLFLPETNFIFGRKSKPKSHWLYFVEPVIKTKKFPDTNGQMILEIRSSGSQTVFPPSVHESGEMIQLEKNGLPGTVASNDLVKGVQRLAAATLLAKHWSSVGSRHEAALALSGALIRCDWPQEDIEKFIEGIAIAANDEEVLDRIKTIDTTKKRIEEGHPATGWNKLAEYIGKDVVSRVMEWVGIVDGSSGNSTLSWETPVPFEQYEVEPFPTKIFPEWLEDYVLHLAEFMEVYPDMPGMFSLSVLSVASSKKFKVSPFPGYEEPVNIWTIVALPPANRKSGIFSALKKPLTEWELHERKKVKYAIAENNAIRKALEQKINYLRNQAQKAGEGEFEAITEQMAEVELELANNPPLFAPRLYTSDATSEALIRLMGQQGGKIAVLSPEGDSIAAISRYSQNRIGNVDTWLKGHAGDDIEDDRISRESNLIQEPAITVGIFVQPIVVSDLVNNEEYRRRGFPARFLYSLPSSKVGYRTFDKTKVPNEIENRYKENVTRILSIQTEKTSILRFSDKAYHAFKEFSLNVEKRLIKDKGDLASFEDWAGKLVGHTARIAGLLHIAKHFTEAGDVEVGSDSVNKAIKLSEYLISHAKRVFGESISESEIEDAKYLIDSIRKRKQSEYSRQRLWQLTKKRFKKVDFLDRAIQTLIDRGYLQEVWTKNKVSGGKNSRRYLINPYVFNDGPKSIDADINVSPNRGHTGPEVGETDMSEKVSRSKTSMANRGNRGTELDTFTQDEIRADNPDDEDTMIL